MTTRRRGRGEGSIYKRADGRWAATVNLGWEAGKRKRKTVYGKSRAHVADKLRQLQNRAADGLPALDERQRTGDYLRWWLANVLPGTVKDSTADNYGYILRRYVMPSIERIPLAKLGPQHVQSMIRSLADQGL
jgi:integrase